MSTELTTIERTVAKARRRLVANTLLAHLGYGLIGGLGLGLVWLLAEPWLIESPPVWLKWAVLGTLSAMGVVTAIVFTRLRAPSQEAAALEVDGRFNLFERVTTVLSLPVVDRATPAGQAVLSDAAAKVANVKVAEKFPIRPRRSSVFVPVLGLLVGVAAVLYDPDTTLADDATEGDGGKKKSQVAKESAKAKAKSELPFTKQKPPEERERAGKSPELLELEKELDKLMEKWAKEPPETEEKKREKAADLTAMEDKLKKFEQEKAAKLEELESKLSKLDKLNQDKEFADGPADKMNDALSKGDLKKAEKEIDELKKKAKDKKLDKQDLAKLEKQMKKMKDEAEKLARNRDEQDKVKEKLDKAKKEGRDKDAETLQRELDKMQKDSEKSKEDMEKLADQMGKIQKAAESGDLEKLAEELDGMKAQVKEIEEELKDIDDADEYLQRVKEELKKACKACEGKDGKDGKEFQETDGNGGKGIGAGRRDENKDARTSSTDERLRGFFDPKGRKSYGGSTKGQAFTKRSTTEMSGDIQKAVQEASGGIDQQSVPRDAKAAVREYMEKLGGNK